MKAIFSGSGAKWKTGFSFKTLRNSYKGIGEQEPGSAGVTDARNFIKLLAGFPVSVEKSTGSKELRADPFSSQVNAGKVKVVRAEWNKKYIEELRQFPRGKNDDMGLK